METIAAYGTLQTQYTLDLILERQRRLADEAEEARIAETARALGRPGHSSKWPGPRGAAAAVGHRIAATTIAFLEALHPTPSDGLAVDDLASRLRDYPYSV